jgi:hypothetical protein
VTATYDVSGDEQPEFARIGSNIVPVPPQPNKIETYGVPLAIAIIGLMGTVGAVAISRWVEAKTTDRRWEVEKRLPPSLILSSKRDSDGAA